MTQIDNRTLLAKADLALADLTSEGGILQSAQAQKFMRVLIDEAVLMKLATVVPMKAQKQLIEKIKFAGRILRPGTEATPLPAADRARPTFSKVELDVKLFKAEVRLNNEVLEDSIERASLRETIMTLMAERLSTDMDEVLIKGDTASADPFLAQFDGIIKQATSHVVVAGGTALNKTILRNMIKAMPTAYMRDKARFKYLTSVDAALDYADSVANRGTVLGDASLEQDRQHQYMGIPVMDIPLFPENLGGGTNETVALLLDPKNINVGIWRQIRIETDKLVSEGVLIVVATLRFDLKFAHEDAVVKATGITVS